jgi:hypothetical protein
MPYPIEPSPMTAMRGLAVSGIRRPLNFLSRNGGARLWLWVSRLGRAAKA